jgi:hypothetical protein
MRVASSQWSGGGKNVFYSGDKRLELLTLEIAFQLKNLQSRHGGDSSVVGEKRVAAADECSRQLDRIARLEFERCSKLCRGFEEVAVNFDTPQSSASPQQRFISVGKGTIISNPPSRSASRYRPTCWRDHRR